MKVSLSPEVGKRVEGLRHLQVVFVGHSAQRFEIVNGLEEVEGDKSTELAGIKEDRATKAMPCLELKSTIGGQDEGALKFINDIKWSRLQNPEGFKLEFYFNPNPYFKNSVLTKTYHVIDDFDPILSQSIGTAIEWYPGKCLTKKVTLKKKPRMGSKIAKTITTNKSCESFFSFFTPPRIPENKDDRDDAAYDELQDRMEQDYILGVIIRDKTIPHAGSWFTGVVTKDDEAEKEEERKEGVKKDDNKDYAEEKERALKMEAEEKKKKKQVDRTSI
ncbi:hypothetical protein SADUNF_Sadunf03G0013500 [Salix dunnii]|uniref:Nucleosome assembly protein 1 n=1 Tax=Salix dunnii TaxID=1413687 RepID=A0A835KCI7_9ROSI|nr:hypothetical protein SADUNF_Sadunf03G0013500 [Salix dunnii]